MVRQENGKFITLEEDINRIFEMHDLEVVGENVTNLQTVGMEGHVWTIYAKTKK